MQLDKNYKLKAPCLKQKKKEEKPWCVLEALCTFWLLWKTQQIHGNNVSKNTGKKICL